ncbi:MAG: GNAT family N-acetyltransferase [Alphaproteobacteria bacterium]|nr:GNAT family N-acetyltransferase [Alphaproteobacteria bacterium]
MTIRPLAAADIPGAAAVLTALDKTLTPSILSERLAKLAGNADHRIWVFEERGTVVGVVHAFVRPALEKPCELVVQSLAVDSTRRSQGIGRALMAEAEQWALSRGLPSVALHTRNAAPFYRKLGYGESAALARMRKILT